MSYVKITNLGITVENGERIPLNKMLTKGTVIFHTTKVSRKGEKEKMVISARFGCQLCSARLGCQIVNFPSCCCGLLIELGLPHLLHL